MRLADALTLSWTNIRQYKRRSLTIILTISLLFALVLGFNFILQGLEDTLKTAAASANDGRIYVYVNYAGLFDSDGRNAPLTVTTQTAITEQVQAAASKYQGEIASETLSPGAGGGWRIVIDEPLARRLSDFSLENLEAETIPYLAPVVERSHSTGYRTVSGIEPDTWLVQVGNYPSTQPGAPTLDGFNPLNLLLSHIYGTNLDYPLIIDDGSGRIDEYLAYLTATDPNSWPDGFGFIATFDNYESATDFANADILPEYIAIDEHRYGLFVSDIFSNALDLDFQIGSLERLLLAVQILFIVVAIIVAVLTFSHLIDQDAATIALYRSLGASGRQIYLVYFLYLLELCVLAALATLGLALLMVGTLYITSAVALSVRLQEFYALEVAPSVSLFGWSPICFIVLGVIIVIAPVAMLFSLGHFAPKNITKKLKEE